jgi:hypothetical protein
LVQSFSPLHLPQDFVVQYCTFSSFFFIRLKNVDISTHLPRSTLGHDEHFE